MIGFPYLVISELWKPGRVGLLCEPLLTAPFGCVAHKSNISLIFFCIILRTNRKPRSIYRQARYVDRVSRRAKHYIVQCFDYAFCKCENNSIDIGIFVTVVSSTVERVECVATWSRAQLRTIVSKGHVAFPCVVEFIPSSWRRRDFRSSIFTRFLRNTFEREPSMHSFRDVCRLIVSALQHWLLIEGLFLAIFF